MIIQPLRSFTGDIDVADFADLALCWDHNDVVSGNVDEVVKWKCRVTGNVVSIVPTAGSAILKDDEGLYSNAPAVSMFISGTMPTVLNTHYAVVVAIGKAHASNSVVGAGVTLGGTTGLKITSAGFSAFNNTNSNVAPALSPTALTNVAKPMTSIGYFDFVDTSSPRIERVVSNDDYTSAVSHASGAGTTSAPSAGAALTPGLISGELGNFPSFSATNSSGRIASVMLFLRTTPIESSAAIQAAITMAYTRRAYAGWRR